LDDWLIILAEPHRKEGTIKRFIRDQLSPTPPFDSTLLFLSPRLNSTLKHRSLDPTANLHLATAAPHSSHLSSAIRLDPHPAQPMTRAPARPTRAPSRPTGWAPPTPNRPSLHLPPIPNVPPAQRTRQREERERKREREREILLTRFVSDHSLACTRDVAQVCDVC